MPPPRVSHTAAATWEALLTPYTPAVHAQECAEQGVNTRTLNSG